MCRFFCCSGTVLFYPVNRIDIQCLTKGKLLACESLPFTGRKLTFCKTKAYLLQTSGMKSVFSDFICSLFPAAGTRLRIETKHAVFVLYDAQAAV